MFGKLLPLALGCLVSACANTVDDYGFSVVRDVEGVSRYVDYQFASSTRLDVPFDAGAKGSVQERQVRVEVGRDYAMTLQLHYREGGPAAQARVVQVAGTQPGDPAGRIAERGLAIPVHVKIGEIKDGYLLPVYDAASTDPDLDGYGGTYYRRGLGVVHLAPGLYQLTVEALQDVPALTYVPVTFDLGPLPSR